MRPGIATSHGENGEQGRGGGTAGGAQDDADAGGRGTAAEGLSNSGGGFDGDSGREYQDGRSVRRGGGWGLEQVSLGGSILELAWTVSWQQHQRRKGLIEPDGEGDQSPGSRLADGRGVAVPG